MKTFTRGNLPKLRDSINNAMQQVLREHGIDAKLGTFSYNEVQATMKIEFTAAGNNVSADAGRTLFEANCQRKGLRKDAYMQDFESQGDLFTIVGINNKAKKYPVSATMKSTGAPYKFPMSMIPSKFHL